MQLHPPTVLISSLLAGLLVACPGSGGDDAGIDGGPDGSTPRDSSAGDSSPGDSSAGDSAVPTDGAVDSMPADGSTARIEIGVGLTEFVPLVDDSPIELTAGPQGGYHVNVTLRMWGLEADDLLIQLEGWDDATDMASTVPVDRVLTTRRVIVGDGHIDRVGERLIFTTFTPEEVTGQRLRIEASATPLVGPAITDVAYGVVVDEE